MELFQVLFRTTIQTMVIGVWSLVLLLWLLGILGRMLGFAWRCFHPARELAQITSAEAEVIDAEWVREL